MDYTLFPTGNGVVGYYKKKKALCFVDDKGKKKIEKEVKKRKLFTDLPFLRGIILFFFGTIALIKGFSYGFVDHVSENKNKLKSILSFVLVVALSFAFSILLFWFCSSKA